jgi:hypothetical protein
LNNICMEDPSACDCMSDADCPGPCNKCVSGSCVFDDCEDCYCVLDSQCTGSCGTGYCCVDGSCTNDCDGGNPLGNPPPPGGGNPSPPPRYQNNDSSILSNMILFDHINTISEGNSHLHMIDNVLSSTKRVLLPNGECVWMECDEHKGGKCPYPECPNK